MRPYLSFLNRGNAGLWLVLMLFVLKAMVPQGFMPATQQGGTLIQLCSAAGPIWVSGPSKQDNAPDERHAAQAATCPVGMALAAVALPPSPVLLSAALAVMAHPLAARAPPGPVHASITGSPLGARAPPPLSVSR
ncbi:DUF2946 family protein [Achromobacter pestifer]|uniref:DUF2946 domain-containing protein n=1 Tax=Achromobacter pestifer TaxID=1353889 RepID=A0A6S6YM00_9BURK|nr:DUF2946 family protein [Achromobacter pestifer]CAB3627226.1 hypothetical protein LMG3431_00498 [Achromobacter pestifer]